MTLLHDKKVMEPCGVGGGGGAAPVVGMNCCSSAASSEISIDEASTSSAASTKINNNLVYEFDKYDYIKTDFPRCKKVDIEFENMKYAVGKFSLQDRKFVTKQILHGINGAFRSGELTAIMGPSGSGKSTLLNVMTGFRSSGVSGTIKVNGQYMSTQSKHFRELSCYIHQNDLLRPQLTVGETMMLAAHLKLGFNVTKDHKTNLIKHILVLLGLDHRFNVFAAKLSGGQKKRLAIALELISNPPVLYLDEPTTGLDSSSCSSCVALLKRLAGQGHTIVCTIHQPSALIFEMFDKLYTVAEGNCIYQGPIRDLIPFLGDQGLVCPSYHNPADFLMEVAIGEHERDLEKLINAANKKYYEDVDINQINRVTRLISKIQENIEKNQSRNKLSNELANYGSAAAFAQFPSFDYVKPVADDLALEEMKALNLSSKNGQKQQTIDAKPTAATTTDEVNTSCSETVMCMSQASFLMQYLLLLRRILVCSRRNYFLLMARIFSHIGIGVIFGYLYHNVGLQATTVLGNYVYLYGTILLLVYTGKMAVVLTFPLEIDMLTREHFNRWYSLGPYFLSLLSFEIPFQSICATLYMLISIYMTGNNSDQAYRIYYFILLGVLATLSAQAWGFFVGATLPTKLAVFLGPILAVLFSVFGFCTRYIDITPLFRWMWHLSYFRAGFHGILNAVYGMDRPFLPCPENVMYCHFRSPKVFLNYMMISDVSLMDSVSLMAIVIGVMHFLTLVTLWYKLNKR